MKTDREDDDPELKARGSEDDPEPKARGLEDEDSNEWITKIRELMAKTKAWM